MEKGIGIAGIAGRMGTLLAEEVRAAGATLVGGIDRPDATVAGGGLFPDIAALAAAAAVVMDFTHASTVQAHARALAQAGTAWVLGTTGLSAEDQAAVAEAATRIAVVQAPNFSPGVNLVLALAERMAAALPAGQYDAEIVEMHHRQKVDAPSGTALGLGHAVARGRGVALEAVKESGRDGHCGARRTGGIGFAALRGGQVVGEHTLLFAAANEHISITHRAFDRRVFATGAVRAALWTHGRPPGLYSMMDVLGMAPPRG
ncbi:4-hydroxy-tetrahydrodipicolinate reductase [Rhodovastum atsumiense]|uniref:4-hydroxy-tetrahydrodipicolinate reductase n=1 Tax=Rhodovastum atsumiense TaxID=504468 RepID=A0A5M6IW32_9PROT|nr:4-hydroxy-tetrahydrodipicolinate reductase [Rhodovastum atsumiense]KAA5612526.1 4-hydroxy-tetrahydrodipicolinate reductase [Rhodovastum atsumiense]CAH2601396.1 4-hydroxy-tetrahydrodipicolinate reductase [Rhodovastum atsumiense]